MAETLKVPREHEWPETRLCTVGRRFAPWFQECSDHVGQSADRLAFDTDMIGPCGYAGDLSRCGTIGDAAMTNRQRDLDALSMEQIARRTALLRAGLGFAELSKGSWRIPERVIAKLSTEGLDSIPFEAH